MANPNWREFMAPGANVPYRSPNVPEQEPMSAPVSEAGGKIVPSGDTSGLYAIYGRKNPHAASADRYSRMSGMDMGGRLGQLPGIAATFMAGRAAKKSEAFEEDRAAKVDAMLARKEAWDKIQNDEAAQRKALETFEKDIAPEAYKAFSSVYSETKDYNAASKAMAEAANAKVSERGLPIPMFKSISPFAKGEFAMIWDNAEGKPVQGMIDKNGNLGKKDANGKIVPADKNDMLFDSYTKLQDAKSRETKSMKGGLRDYDLAELGKQLDSLRKLKIEDTLSDAEQAQYEAIQAEYNRKAGIVIPEKPAESPAAPAPAAPTPGVMGRIKNVFTGELGGPDQPHAAAPQAQTQPTQGLIRRASGGRIALFDPSTKAFVRWE